MEQSQIIQSLVKLGEFLQNSNTNEIKDLINVSQIKNKWFTPDNTKLSFENWSKNLNEENLISWSNQYSFNSITSKRIGIITAGNIPMVGFHDIISTLISGNKAVIKLSSKDDMIIPFLLKQLESFNPALADRYEIVENLKDFDAVIATGSNNTSRYFESYFKHVPHIIRKNRTSIALLDGLETKEQLFTLGKDIFQYYGQGCRNVSKLYVPSGYNVQPFFEAIDDHGDVMLNNKYKNNFDYNYSIYLLNKVDHYTNNFMILENNTSLHSPTSVLFYEEYADVEDLKEKIKMNASGIQCMVSDHIDLPGTLKFGEAQNPSLDTYADNVDTMAFLSQL